MSANVSSGKPADAGRLNILFSCAGRRVALIRAFREAMAELGLTGELVATDISMTAPAMHVVDRAELVPRTDAPHYMDRLTELVRRHAIRLLIPLTDLDLALLSQHASALAELGCAVMIAPEATVDACRDKIAFNELVAQAGLPTARTMTLDQFEANPFYPCFVKPIGGSASIGTATLNGPGELAAHTRTFGTNLMIQEYLAGSEYTIDIFRRRDGEICAIVPRQRLAVRAGEVAKAVTVNDADLIAAARSLVEHMPGLWGVINLQCRRAPGGQPFFFEANLRFGGGAPLTIAAGVNLPKMLIADLLGRPVSTADGAFTDRLLMTRYDDAVFVPVEDPAVLPGYDQPLDR